MESHRDMSIWKSTVLDVIETILPRASDLGSRELEQYALDTLEHDRDEKCVMLLKRHETYKLLSKGSTAKAINTSKSRSKGQSNQNQELDNHAIRFGRLRLGSEGGAREESRVTNLNSPGMSTKEGFPKMPKKRFSSILSERLSGVFRSSSGGSDEIRSYDYENVRDESVLQAPITDICIVTRNDPPPPGFYRISQTRSLKRANLNASSGGLPQYLCIRKAVASTGADIDNSTTTASSSGDYSGSSGVSTKKPPGMGSYGNNPGAGILDAMPVVAVQVIFPDRGEFLPMGFTVARIGSAKTPANLNQGVAGSERVYLAYKRDYNGNPLIDLLPVLKGAGEAVPEDFQLVDRTLSGIIANLNSGTGGSPLFLSYYQRLRQLQPLRSAASGKQNDRANRQRGESGDSVSSSNSDFGVTYPPSASVYPKQGSNNTSTNSSHEDLQVLQESSASTGDFVTKDGNDHDQTDPGDEFIGKRTRNYSVASSSSSNSSSSSVSSSSSEDDADSLSSGSSEEEGENSEDEVMMLSEGFLRSSQRLSLDLSRGDGYVLRNNYTYSRASRARREVVVDAMGAPRDAASCRSLLLLSTALYNRNKAVSDAAIYGFIILLKNSTFFDMDFLQAPVPGSLTLSHIATEAVCDRMDLGDDRETRYLLLWLLLLSKRAQGNIPAATVSRIFKSLYNATGNQSTTDDWITRGISLHPCRHFDFEQTSGTAGSASPGAIDGTKVSLQEERITNTGVGSGSEKESVARQLEAIGYSLAPDGVSVLIVFSSLLSSFATPLDRLHSTDNEAFSKLLDFLPTEGDVGIDINTANGNSEDTSRSGTNHPEADVPLRRASGTTSSTSGNAAYTKDYTRFHSGRMVVGPEWDLCQALVLDLVDEVTNNVEIASIVDTAKKVVARSGLSASGSSFWSQVNILSKMLFLQSQMQGTFMLLLGACKMCYGGLRYEAIGHRAGTGKGTGTQQRVRNSRRGSSAGISPNVRDYGLKVTGLVLLECLLSKSRETIKSSRIMGYAVRRVVVPCLIHNVPAALQDHRLFSRLLAVITALWRNWRVHLRVELAFLVEILVISVMLGDVRAVFQMTVIQEVVKWFDQPQLLVEMFVNYDIADSHHLFLGHWNLFGHLVRSVSFTAKKIDCGLGIGLLSSDGGSKNRSDDAVDRKSSSGGTKGSSTSRSTEDDDGDAAIVGLNMPNMCSYFALHDAAYISSITARNVHIQALEEVCRIAKTLMDASGHAFLISQDREFRERSLEAGAGWEDDNDDTRGYASAKELTSDTEDGDGAWAEESGGGEVTLEEAAVWASKQAHNASRARKRADDAAPVTKRSSRVHSIAMRRASHQERGDTLEQAVNIYEQKHSVGKAVRYLISKCFISDTPQEIASFLRLYKHRFDPTAIGDYLGTEGAHHEQILFRYIRATSFAEMPVEPALRLFLTDLGFRLPGEGQKVERFVTCFEKVYWADNSGTPQCPFRASNTVFLVAYAIIMLNSDHHRANIGKRSKAKMTKEAFVKNLAGTDVDGDIEQAYLEAIFESVESTPIEMDFATSEEVPNGSRVTSRGAGAALHMRYMHHSTTGGSIDSTALSGERAVQYLEKFQKATCQELKGCEDVLRAMRSFGFRFQLTGKETNISLDLVSFMYETVCYHFRAITKALLAQPSTDMFVTFHALDLLSYVLTSSIFLGLQEEKAQLAKQLLDFQIEYCVKNHTGNKPGGGGDSELLTREEWSTPRSKPGLSQAWYRDVVDLPKADPRTMEVISRLHKLIVHLKDECQEISSHELTASVAARIEGTRSILSKNAYFVREGSLMKVSQRNGNQKQYRFFLFSDELIYAQVGLLGGNYRIHGQLSLQHMTVTDIDSDPTHCSLFVDHPHKSFIVVCPSPLTKNLWVRDLHQAIANCNLRVVVGIEESHETGHNHSNANGNGNGNGYVQATGLINKKIQFPDSRGSNSPLKASDPSSATGQATGDKPASVLQPASHFVSDDSSDITMDSDDSADVEDFEAAQRIISERRKQKNARELSPADKQNIEQRGGDWYVLESESRDSSSEDEDL